MSSLPSAEIQPKPILLTGANGRLGAYLRPHLLAQYGQLLSTDLLPLDIGPLPGEVFARADLAEGGAIDALVARAGAIIHFGGIPREGPFQAILNTNILGTYNIFESARRHGVPRVIFASSNHVMGFHPSTEELTTHTRPRPDSLYGVSKIYGEALGQLYADKHGLKVACLRIGSCLPAPTLPRHLATWLSIPDLCRLVDACLAAPALHYEILYGLSANAGALWHNPADSTVAYAPQDNAQHFAAALAEQTHAVDPAAHLHGGNMCLRRDWRD
jgi:uronate dehydrogenase